MAVPFQRMGGRAMVLILFGILARGLDVVVFLFYVF